MESETSDKNFVIERIMFKGLAVAKVKGFYQSLYDFDMI